MILLIERVNTLTYFESGQFLFFIYSFQVLYIYLKRQSRGIFSFKIKPYTFKNKIALVINLERIVICFPLFEIRV